MRTAEFIRALPKAELHLHLEGAVPWALARAKAPTLPERPPWYADGFQFDDFLQFRGAVRDCMSYLTDAGAYGAAAGAIFRGLHAQNVRYAEISFDVAPISSVVDATSVAMTSCCLAVAEISVMDVFTCMPDFSRWLLSSPSGCVMAFSR